MENSNFDNSNEYKYQFNKGVNLTYNELTDAIPFPYSELESLVNYDMYINGFNPTDKNHVEMYWKERLS